MPRAMTSYLYGRPPAVFDPPADAIQTSPLIPGSADLGTVPAGSADAVTLLAPPGAVERRFVLAQALSALKPGGRLDVMAPKDKGGQRLRKELQSFRLTFDETAKAHHRRAVAVRPGIVEGIETALAEGGPREVGAIGGWSQPGVFAWDRVDAGTALLLTHLPSLKGRGADLGCGAGLIARAVLTLPDVVQLRLVDLDRRAVEAARRNIEDARAVFEWADARGLQASGDLDFIAANPPFHDGGTEDRRLGQGFIRAAAGLLRKGGVLWLVANRHLPYERELDEAFARTRLVVEAGGYKVFEAVK